MSFRVAGYQSEDYTVQTPVYQGPLDLLLDLIESAQLDITALALAQVTDQYIEYMNRMLEKDAGEVSAFLVIAAKLLHIKSIALLPRPSVQVEMGEEEDPGEALAAQLREYKRFKDLSKALLERETLGLRTYIRMNIPRPNLEIKPDLDELTLEALIAAARSAFAVHSATPLNHVVNMPRIRIKDKMKTIVQLLRESNGEMIPFHRVLKNATRVEIVVAFLAMLELIKQHMVFAEQSERFGEIRIHRTEHLAEFLDDTELEFTE
ncbi:MAG: segregation/condensation protein A [Anaerolineae bacterium]|nr:segregation/condensation protein A [Anaerolineae bacterium]